MLGREATVVCVAKRPSERRRRERSSFVRRVLNKQDEGLFRKSNSHQACLVRYYLSEIMAFTFASLPLNFYSSVSGCDRFLANRLIWQGSADLHTPIHRP